MSITSTNGKPFRVEATADVGAPAADVYRMIADYRVGHTRIIPPRYFRNLQVEKGGYGNGTVITYDMTAFGKTRQVRAHVTEPEPGRVIVESDREEQIVTTFVVEPSGPARSRVTIATELPLPGGIAGAIGRVMTRSFLTRVFTAELAQLDEQVKIG